MNLVRIFPKEIKREKGKKIKLKKKFVCKIAFVPFARKSFCDETWTMGAASFFIGGYG